MRPLLLRCALLLIVSTASAAAAIAESQHRPWPKSCAEAVARLSRELPPDERRRLAAMPEDKLILLHHGFGTHIRNSLGLWQGNRDLAFDCTKQRAAHPDEASMAIIRALWQSLQR
ncbi:DUF6794 domain-containing protein [Vannielia litorea]|uniref:DUF6794 domain-containing protein n=1 Tax=Vannielia litorea TaxID=1217970 RepID=UPI001BCB8821|nr:DUF6794 domain-containing protein [Vannielia litorea]